jgi:hypothetical protein
MALLIKDMRPVKHCPDCDATIGSVHFKDCDIESCTKCGLQKLSCGCRTEERETWTGIPNYRMRKFCEENNLFTMWDELFGWVPASKDDPRSMHDLNRAAVMMSKKNGK